METLELTGVWWLPEREDYVAGTLTYNGDSDPHLRLIGVLRELTGPIEPTNRYPIILGVAGGKNITLVRSQEVNMRITVPGIPTSELISEIVVVGAHIRDEADVVFERLSIAYENLINWSGLSALSNSYRPARDGERANYTISAYALSEHPFPMGDAQLQFVSSWTTANNPNQMSVTQELYVEVVPPTSLELSAYLNNYFYHVQNFLSLGVASPQGIRQVNGTVKDAHGGVDYVQITFDARKGNEKQLNPWDMLFTKTDLGEAWPGALNRWFERAEILKPVYDLFFSSIFAPNAYLEHRFLSLTQALESYHRRTEVGVLLERNTFEGLRGNLERVIRDYPGLHRDVVVALGERLKYFNEFSQRRRLKETLRKVGALTQTLIPNESQFVEKVITTRNYLTHFDAASAHAAASGERLWKLTEQLRFLIEMCFLLEIGVDRQAISALCSNHRRYQHLARELPNIN